MPSVHYLQKLGPEYLELILDSSYWIFERCSDIGFEVMFKLPSSMSGH